MYWWPVRALRNMIVIERRLTERKRESSTTPMIVDRDQAELVLRPVPALNVLPSASSGIARSRAASPRAR